MRHYLILVLVALLSGLCCAQEVKIGDVSLQQVAHHDQLTGPNDHFGSLLFNASGHLVLHNENRTWLYTGAKVSGQWISFVREFDLDTLGVTPRQKILDVYGRDRWASVHLAIQAANDLVLVFYSTGKRIRAAISNRPDSAFTTEPQFSMGASQKWEAGCSLESDCGFVPISNDEKELRIWMLYDTLCTGSTGQNGWAEIRIDKRARRIQLVRKHPQNPIPLLRPGFVAARTGGNVDSRIRFNDQHALFYLSKKTSKSYRIAVALSRDPLFQTLTENREMGGPLGEERVIEKFQFYKHDGDLFLIYENADRYNDWRTSLRRFRITN